MQRLPFKASIPMGFRVDPQALARLLRSDVLPANLSPEASDQIFAAWWGLEASLDYPAWPELAASRRDPRWFEAEPEAGTVGPFPVTPIFRYLMARHPELSAPLDLTSAIGLSQAMAWFFVHGLAAHRMAALVPQRFREALASPVPFLAHGERHDPTWLAFFVWLCDARLQARFPLGQPPSHRQLAATVARFLRGRPHLGELLARMPPTVRRIPALNARKAERAPARRPFGVNLVGHVRGEFGVGEDVRMAAEACAAVGVPFSLVDFPAGPGTRQRDLQYAEQAKRVGAKDSAPYETNLFCMTAFETARCYLEHGPVLFTGRRNIGWWPWELPVWPVAWDPVLSLVDEIWASSQFTQQAYAAAVDRALPADERPKVRLMPLPVSVARIESTPRRRLGLPTRAFLFLFVFDFNSTIARKNPLAAITAFRRAFPEDCDVGLVIKTMNGQAHPAASRKLRAACTEDPRIKLLDHTLRRGEVLGLMANCDAYLSLHRSEGFGRTLAEAMLVGKPVIATDFSGSADFLDASTGYPVRWRRKVVRAGEYPFVSATDHAWWAEPDLEHAASQMQAARRGECTPSLSSQVEQFAPSSVGREMLDALTSHKAHVLRSRL